MNSPPCCPPLFCGKPGPRGLRVLARQAATRLLRFAPPLRVTACAPSGIRRPCQGRLAASAAHSLLIAGDVGDDPHTLELVEPPRPKAIPRTCLGFPLRITRRASGVAD